MEDQELANEKGLHQLTKQAFANSRIEALGVAYFDFILGITGFVIGLMYMVRTNSFYPFVVPRGLEADMAGPFARHLVYLALFLAFFFLLMCSVCLLLGILLNNPCLVNFWYCPNVIFLLMHTGLVVTTAFFEFWSVYAVAGSIFALRIFALLKIYNFQNNMELYFAENKRLENRCQINPDIECPHPEMRQNDLSSHHKFDIAREAKVVTGAVFAEIDKEIIENPPEYPGTTANTGDAETHYHDHEPNVYNSSLYSHSKLRRGTGVNI